MKPKEVLESQFIRKTKPEQNRTEGATQLPVVSLLMIQGKLKNKQTNKQSPTELLLELIPENPLARL